MNIDSPKYWEDRLKEFGMPSEIKFEKEKAARDGVDLVSIDMADPEAETLAQKLQEEDPNNIFGGFPNSLNMMVSLIETLREEWIKQNVQLRDIRLFIHSSCVNKHDCITLFNIKSGKKYHYNTKNIRGYSRQKIISRLTSKGLSVEEK